MATDKYGLGTVLDDAQERHGLIEGLYDGWRGEPGVDQDVLAKYDGESWYPKAGYMLGAALSTRAMSFGMGAAAMYALTHPRAVKTGVAGLWYSVRPILGL